MKPQDFTRNRKIGFAGTMLIVLNKTGRGLKSAIRAYRETVALLRAGILQWQNADKTGSIPRDYYNDCGRVLC